MMIRHDDSGAKFPCPPDAVVRGGTEPLVGDPRHDITETISTGLSRLLGPGRGAADAARIRFDFDAGLDVVDDLPAAPAPAPTPPGVTP